MKMAPMKSIVLVLIVSVTLATFMQSRGEAMLVPAQIAQQGQASVRAADQDTIQKTLESKVLRSKLHALGLSDPEIDARLSRLSDAQRHQLASQIRAVNPAGDGGFIIGLLVVVVLVLLIIYLVKRV